MDYHPVFDPMKVYIREEHFEADLKVKYKDESIPTEVFTGPQAPRNAHESILMHEMMQQRE